MDCGKIGIFLVILGIVIDFSVRGILRRVVFGENAFSCQCVSDCGVYGGCRKPAVRLSGILRLWRKRSLRRLLRWPHRRLLQRLCRHRPLRLSCYRYRAVRRIGRLLHGTAIGRGCGLLCRCRHRLRLLLWLWLRLAVPVHPSARTGCPCSSPSSASIMLSIFFSLAAWHGGVPGRVR